MNLFFWMLLNLGVPIFGPMLTLALIAPTHGWHVAKRLIAASVKDGQLFWCAIGLCAAGVYEAMSALEQGRGRVPVLELGIGVYSFFAFICSTIVTLMSLASYEHQTGGRADAIRSARLESMQRRQAIWSIYLTAAATILFVVLHIYLIWFWDRALFIMDT